VLGPGDRDNVLTLRQQPGQRQLRRSALFPLRNILYSLDQVQIFLEVFALETGRVAPVIIFR
jgi:hypothetical protein